MTTMDCRKLVGEKITFFLTDLIDKLNHARKCKQQVDFVGDNGPCVMLVKDQGVYLMSSGRPMEDEKIRAVYAIGTSKNTHYDGDDFVEVLFGSLIDEMVSQAKGTCGVKGAKVEFVFSDNSMDISLFG